MAKKLVVAVSATQLGATFASFDQARFDHEVVGPVKTFLEKVHDACVVLFFYGGEGVDSEEVRDDPRSEEGLPYHKATPSSVATLKAFSAEKAAGTVEVLVFTDELSLPEHARRLRSSLRPGAEAEVRVVPLDRLDEIAMEMNAHLLA